MPFPWNFLGDLFSDQASSATQFAYQRQLAQEQRDWQERMSNTAYQRQVADLDAAGLSKVLAYGKGGGGGATTPSGGMGSVGRGRVSFSESQARSAAAKQAAATTDKLNQDRENSIATTAAQVAESEARTKLYNAQTTREEGLGPFYQAMERVLSGIGDSLSEIAEGMGASEGTAGTIGDVATLATMFVPGFFGLKIAGRLVPMGRLMSHPAVRNLSRQAKQALMRAARKARDLGKSTPKAGSQRGQNAFMVPKDPKEAVRPRPRQGWTQGPPVPPPRDEDIPF